MPLNVRSNITLGRSNFHNASRLGHSNLSFPSGFDPRSLGNLAAWYDARYPAGFGGALPADGTALAQWNDLSGNGRHATQGTGSFQPLFRSANPNLLTYNQASTETSLDATYTPRSAATVARSTAQAAHGTASAAATSTAAGTAGINCGTVSGGSAIPVTPNAVYTASIELRHGTLSPTVTVGLSWWTSGGTFLSQTTVNVGVTSTGWTQKTITATADPAAAYGMVYAQWTAAGAGEVLYVDAVGLAQGSSTTWLPPVTLPNGLATVQFDGANDTLATAAFTNVAQPRTVYAVSFRASDNGNASTLFDGLDGTHRQAIALPTAATTASLNGGSAITSGSGVAAVGAAHVYSGLLNGASSELRIDGTSVVTGNAGANGSTGFTLGSAYGGTLPLQGNLAAFLAYDAAHTTTQRQAAERWLGRTWGVSVA